MAMNGKVKVINYEDNNPKEVQIADGTTVGELFTAENGLKDMESFTVLVNGKDADKSTVLHSDDRVGIYPKNIKGAR